MKFSTAVALSILAPSTVLGAALLPRVNHPTQDDCFLAGKNVNLYNGPKGGAYDQSCPDVIFHCELAVNSSIINQNPNGAINNDLWNTPHCVAAAACHSADAAYTFAGCANSQLPNRADSQKMTKATWKKIVGSDGPMTQQNFIDFIYGEMASFNATNWPVNASFVIDNWWTPMKTWVNRGETVPFDNFNDWLHYS